MKGKKWLVLVIGLGVVLLASSVGVTRGSLVDLESSSDNSFQAWTSTKWVQTSEADFEAGVLNNVDTWSSPGDVKLANTSNWYDSNWSYRRQITIDHTKVDDVADPSTTYADFPVLVYATGLSNIIAGGADIRFTSSDGITELPREIESYSGGTLYAWVKVTLTKDASDSTDDVIYMYYGNGSASEPPEGSTYGAQNVWDYNYLGVWHLNETVTDEQTTGTHYDSTSNDYDGSQNGNDDTAGKMANGQDYDGNDYVNVASPSAPTEKTFSLWIYANSLVEDFHTLIEFGDDAPWFGLAVWEGDWYLLEYDKNCWGKTILSTGQWYHVVYTSDSTIGKDGQGKVYLNGVDDTETASKANTETGSGMGIAFHSGDPSFNGIIDEVRVSNTPRSANWIKTGYNNQNSPSTFYSVGGEEVQYVSPGTIASDVLDTGVTGARWDALFWDETLETNTDITFEVRASDTPFLPDAGTPSWVPVGGSSPVTSGLPSGQYKQWRATLTTSDTSKTPTLHEVRVYHY